MLIRCVLLRLCVGIILFRQNSLFELEEDVSTSSTLSDSEKRDSDLGADEEKKTSQGLGDFSENPFAGGESAPLPIKIELPTEYPYDVCVHTPFEVEWFGQTCKFVQGEVILVFSKGTTNPDRVAGIKRDGQDNRTYYFLESLLSENTTVVENVDDEIPSDRDLSL